MEDRVPNMKGTIIALTLAVASTAAESPAE